MKQTILQYISTTFLGLSSFVILLSITLLCSFGGGYYWWYYYNPEPYFLFDSSLPEREIAFISSDNIGISFINSDGSNRIDKELEIRTYQGGSGVIRNQVNSIYWGTNQSIAFTVPSSGSNARTVTSTGQIQGRNCYLGDKNHFTSSAISIAPDGYEVAVLGENLTKSRVAKISLENCLIIEDNIVQSGEKHNILIFATYSSLGDLAVSSATLNDYNYSIEIISQTPAFLNFAIPDAVWGNWSPNGDYLAYVSTDGYYYIIELNGEKKKLITSISTTNTVPDKFKENYLLTWNPPSWSPDGQWLLITKLNKSQSVDLYKVNILTGEEVFIVNNVDYATWNPND